MDGKKFTIGKYRINTMVIIKLFPIIFFMPVSNSPSLKFLLCTKGIPFQSLVNSGGYSKQPTAKIADSALRLKKREKTRCLR